APKEREPTTKPKHKLQSEPNTDPAAQNATTHQHVLHRTLRGRHVFPEPPPSSLPENIVTEPTKSSNTPDSTGIKTTTKEQHPTTVLEVLR
ncbi:unnamed protein product, partial [Brassica rapa]